MGLFDDLGGSLKGALGQAAAAAPALIAAALGKTNLGLQGVAEKLQQNGLGAQVVSARYELKHRDHTRSAADRAGQRHVKKIAADLGLSTDEALKVLAQHLPRSIRRAPTAR